MSRKRSKKFVTAYSEVWIYSITFPVLKENYNNPRSSPVAADVGQRGTSWRGLRRKPSRTGASKLYIEIVG